MSGCWNVWGSALSGFAGNVTFLVFSTPPVYLAGLSRKFPFGGTMVYGFIDRWLVYSLISDETASPENFIQINYTEQVTLVKF